MNKTLVKSDLKRVIKIGGKPFIISLIGCVLTSVLNLLILVFTNMIISEITNQALANEFDIQKLIQIGLLLLLIIPFYFLGLQFNVRGGLYASTLFKGKLISKSLHHHESLIKDGHSSSIMSVFTSDGETIDDFYFQSLNWRIVQPIVQGVLAIALLIYQNYAIGILCIVIGIVNVYVSSRYNNQIQEIDKNARELYQIHTKTLSSIIANDDVVRLLNIKEDVISIYEKENQSFANAMIESESLKEKINSWNSLFTVLSRSLLLGIGVYLFAQGSMSFGVIFILIPLQSSVSSMFSGLVTSRNYLSEVANAARRSFDIMDATSENMKDECESIASTNKPSLEFRNIEFSYSNEHELFKDFNLNIPSGSTCAFVGESGSGKSTLFQLLLGLYNPNDGTIEIDGKDISNVNLESLRNKIVYIEQTSPLFARTIRENIAIGANMDIDKVSLDDVMSAAKKAYIHDFIMELPDQYETVLSDNANMLSGGQKQRIAIARAFMSKAPILIMDEPTSALDNESERKVQLALDELKGNKTVLIAAHRLSTIKDADKIVVLKSGQIVEQGTHEELLSNQAYYSSLNHTQSN